VIRARPTKLTASSISWTMRRFFLPKKNRATASAEPGNHRLVLLPRTADVVVVVTVKADAMLPSAVTVAGAKLHAAPAGNPEHENATVEVVEKPFSGVTVAVPVPLDPAVTVREAGATASVKSGGGGAAAVVELACVEAGELPKESEASTR